MTDERLEQILKQALSPEISDAEIEIREKVRKKSMRKIVKAGVTVVAALAVVAAGVGTHFFSFGGTFGEGAAKGENSFILRAYAAELGSSEEVPLAIDAEVQQEKDVTFEFGNHALCSIVGEEENGHVAFCIDTAFQCEGEGINRVTYSINRGAFEIAEGAFGGNAAPTGSIILDEEPFEEELHCPDVMAENGVTRVRLVKEYSLAGDAQSSDTTKIMVCGDIWDADIYNLLWKSDGGNVKEREEMYKRLVGDVEITCTVYFTDGSSASKDIIVQAKSMALREAGIDGGKSLPDTEMVFFVFGLKEDSSAL